MSSSPKWNIALEDYLHRQKAKLDPESNWIYIWQNSPVLVIGRNQNPWIECNLNYLREQNIEIVRRQSGGGAVYHDLGNTCITFFSQKHQPEYNLNFVIDSLKASFGIETYLSPRKDIFWNNRKVSGSAYRITHNACYHHLTLLWNADLEVLNQSLQPTLSSLETKATESVRSKVANLSEFDSSIKHESICVSLSKHFEELNGTSEIKYYTQSDIESINDIKEEYMRLSDWDWIFGKTPRFTQLLKGDFQWGSIELVITFNRGYIENLESNNPIDVKLFDNLKVCMINAKYCPLALRERFDINIVLLGGDTTVASMLEETAEWILEHIKM